MKFRWQSKPKMRSDRRQMRKKAEQLYIEYNVSLIVFDIIECNYRTHKKKKEYAKAVKKYQDNIDAEYTLYVSVNVSLKV